MKIIKKNYKINNTIYIKSRALPCLNGRCIIPRCSRFHYLINIYSMTIHGGGCAEVPNILRCGG